MALEAFFLPAASGERFCLFHESEVSGEPKGMVIYLAPFAEEMNRSRRMASLQSRALARAGFSVLQLDLQGCGDSSGDFGDASWDGWLDDAALACAWSRRQSAAPLWLWGLRAGCLLAAQAAQRLDEPANLLLWQPVLSGRQHLQQFLRLKLAADLEAVPGREDTIQLRKRLDAGGSVEVAGYALSPGLAAGLEAAELVPSGKAGRLRWIEVDDDAKPALRPASAACLDAWRAAGFETSAQAVAGSCFWEASEPEDVPSLIDATLATLAA